VVSSSPASSAPPAHSLPHRPSPMSCCRRPTPYRADLAYSQATSPPRTTHCITYMLADRVPPLLPPTQYTNLIPMYCRIVASAAGCSEGTEGDVLRKTHSLAQCESKCRDWSGVYSHDVNMLVAHGTACGKRPPFAGIDVGCGLHGVSCDALAPAEVLLCIETQSIKGSTVDSTVCTVSSKGVLYPQRVYCILKGCAVSSKGVLYPQRVYCILKGCIVSSKSVLYPQRVYCTCMETRSMAPTSEGLPRASTVRMVNCPPDWTIVQGEDERGVP
jgi:hypothetical protein